MEEIVRTIYARVAHDVLVVTAMYGSSALCKKTTCAYNSLCRVVSVEAADCESEACLWYMQQQPQEQFPSVLVKTTNIVLEHEGWFVS